jgi:hypothetical protein
MSMTAALTESYGKGATDVPLIEQPIGDFFDDMVARNPTAKPSSAATKACASPTASCRLNRTNSRARC